MLKSQVREFEQLTKDACRCSGGPILFGKIVKCSGNHLIANGLTLPVGYLVNVEVENSAGVLAEVTAFDRQHLVLTPYRQDIAVTEGALVEPLNDTAMVATGHEMLGRAFDPLGNCLNGGMPLRNKSAWPLLGHLDNILNRGRVRKPLESGVHTIDALLPIGVGQRIAVVAGSGVGKSQLMRQLIAGSEAEIIVAGLIGERAREISDFIEFKRESGLSDKTVTVAVPADHSPILRIKAAQRATAIAEYFSAEGKNVLLVIDSLTRVAHAQREIGLSLGEPPTMKGYPPSSIALIPRLIERAGQNVRSGGSITAFYSVLAESDDLDDPIVDAVRAIADGHLILSREMAEQNIYPAIDITKSISRVADDLITDEHRSAIKKFERLWGSFEENRDLILMGAHQPGNDALVDEAILRRPAQKAFLKQEMASKTDRQESIAQLVEEFGNE